MHKKVEFNKEDILSCLRYMNGEQEVRHHFRFILDTRTNQVVLDGIDFWLKDDNA
jgi:hypothetical protein